MTDTTAMTGSDHRRADGLTIGGTVGVGHYTAHSTEEGLVKMAESRRIVRSTLEVSLYTHPFKEGENLWSYAERQAKEAVGDGAWVERVEAEVKPFDVASNQDNAEGRRRYVPGPQWVIIEFGFRAKQGDDTNDN